MRCLWRSHIVRPFLVFILPVGLSGFAALAQAASSQTSNDQSQVVVPTRPSKPAFTGQQGKQKSEIQFNRTSRTVTITLRVQDPNGYFLPNIRRDNFAVYEDGVRQRDVNVEVEHAPIVVSLLMEFGGRYETLNQALVIEISNIGHQLLAFTGKQDKISIFKFSSSLQPLADFNTPHDALDGVFERLGNPPSSETNFYDALFQTLSRMRNIEGRKAIIVLSTGYDTFSKTTYQRLLQTVESDSIPIYTIGLIRLVEQQADLYGPIAPFTHVDWQGAEQKLEMLARASGGRAYVPESDIEIPAIYDDIMENLRLRYVITYVSSNPGTSGPPRDIRVELVNPQTGDPLEVRDSNGHIIMPRLFVQKSYTPNAAGN